MLVLFVTFLPLPLNKYVRFLAGPWEDPTGPVLIVLAADETDESLIGQSAYWRSAYAVRAWRTHAFRYILLSGDLLSTAPMRDFLIGHGVPADVIRIEGKSRSTRENALFAGAMLKTLPGPYVLLTSDYHMWRSQRCFTRVGISVLPRPFPDALKRFSRWNYRWQAFLDVAEESIKIVYYWAKGWI